VIDVGCGGEGTGERTGLRFEGTEPEDCSDDADNDADGFFDCDDSGCSGASVCSDGGVGDAGGFGGMMGSGGIAGGSGTGGTGGVGGVAGVGGTGGIGGVGGVAGTGGTAGGGGIGGSGGVTLDCATLADPPPDCQKSCTSDSQCEASFCANGSCLAHCTADEGCAAGSSCNVSGRCVPDVGTGGMGGSGNTGGGACQSVEVTPTRSIPNVMFLVDESSSMVRSFGGGLDRWQAAHQAIVGNPNANPPVVGIVEQLQSIVRFGLTTYHSQGGFGAPGENKECPIFETEVAIALDNHSEIDASYPADFQGIGVDTPTGESIVRLVEELQETPPPADGPTIIVLATDGEPDTCATPNPQEGQPQAVAAAKNAFDLAGIQTFILSVGNDVSDAHLQEMANAGTGLAPDGSQGDADFWKATTPQGLEDAFNAIIGASISCDIQMDKQFNDKVKACNDGDVRLNGTPLSCPGKWQVKPGADDVIELVGSACDTFKSGSSTFTAVFPCGAIVVE
jgi:hypothetical protein